MTYKEKLVEAAKLLKEYCFENCYACIFNQATGGCIISGESSPKFWKIPKIIRLSPEEIALAKSLNTFGIDCILMNETGDEVSFYRGNVCYGTARSMIFSSIPRGESVNIEDIFKASDE